MSSGELDGGLAFEKVLDRWESAITREGAERERLEQARTAQRQAERERESANSNRDHWKALAERREEKIALMQARCSQLADKIRALGFDVPDEPAVPAFLAPAPEKKPTDDDMPF